MNIVLYKKIRLVIVCLLFVVDSFAQSVIVESKLDSLEMLIGSQTKLTIKTTCDADSKVSYPIFNDTIVNGLEIIENVDADTAFINDGKRMTISKSYIVSAYDSAFFYIPGVDINVDSKIYKSNDLVLKVYLMPIDSPDVRTVKGIINPKFILSDWLGLFSSLLFLVICIILIIYFFRRFRDNKPIVRKIHVEPEKLPHEQAVISLENIKSKKLAYSENLKLFYTELTDVLRLYISSRFGFNAMEMTSSEISEKLLEFVDKDNVRNIDQFLALSDLVKFAKYKPLLNENDANILLVIDFINKTKKEIPIEQREKPHDIIIEEPRSRKTKIFLLSLLVILCIILICLFIYICVEVNSMLL